jgi:multidrug resistance efflux pump
MNKGGRFFGLDKNWWKSKEGRALDEAKSRLKATEKELADERGALARSNAKLNVSEAKLREAQGSLERALDTYVDEVIQGWDTRGTKDEMDAYAAGVKSNLKRYSEKVRPETMQSVLLKIRAIDADLYRAVTSE